MLGRPLRFFSLAPLLLAAACGSDPERASPSHGQASGSGGSDPSSGGAGGSAGSVGSAGAGGADVAPACAAPSASHCATPNEGSVVRGVARLAPGFTPPMGTKGRLTIGMMHARFGEEATGGHPHWYKTINDVDLANGPVPFDIDMCDGNNEMWSEDNCEFNIIVVLDTNKNNGPQATKLNMVPDVGEAGWHQIMNISCNTESPCLDVRFDCTDGASCINYEPLGACKCAPEACNPAVATCTK